MAVVLTIGLAMGTVSTLSLNMVRNDMVEQQTELVARSGLARFLEEVWVLDQRDFDVLNPQPLDLVAHFRDRTLLSDEDRACGVSFEDDGEPFSTDNLSNDQPKAGWLDRGGTTTSVPPFSLEVILRASYQGHKRYYRVLLQRTWPYAVYATEGPVVLMGTPDPDRPNPFEQPARVEGDLFTSYDGNSGRAPTAGYGLGPIRNTADLLAFYETSRGFYPYTTQNFVVAVGPGARQTTGPEGTVVDRTDNAVYVLYPPTEVVFGERPVVSVVNYGLEDRNNVIDGDVYYHHRQGLEFPPLVPDGNQLTGEAIARRQLHPDPVASLEEPNTDSGVALGLTPPPEDALDHLGISADDTIAPPDYHMLGETLVLSPDVNSANGVTSSVYFFDGSISNRAAYLVDNEGEPIIPTVLEQEFPDQSLVVQERPAGLELQSCTLHIRGDLDLGAGHLETPPRIFGNDATIVVDGKLILSGAEIDAGDQGFVIYADDIVLKGGGSYRGLMVSRRSLRILPKEGAQLTIEGGLICAGPGGVMLNSITVRHDPRYLKAVNGAGDLQVSGWAPLNP